jgi:hypothetical protein
MIANRQSIARLQSDFYRDQYRKILRWLVVCVVIIYLLIMGIIYCVFIQSPQNYYANTVDGTIMPMPQQIG